MSYIATKNNPPNLHCDTSYTDIPVNNEELDHHVNQLPNRQPFSSSSAIPLISSPIKVTNLFNDDDTNYVPSTPTNVVNDDIVRPSSELDAMWQAQNPHKNLKSTTSNIISDTVDAKNSLYCNSSFQCSQSSSHVFNRALLHPTLKKVPYAFDDSSKDDTHLPNKHPNLHSTLNIDFDEDSTKIQKLTHDLAQASEIIIQTSKNLNRLFHIPAIFF